MFGMIFVAFSSGCVACYLCGFTSFSYLVSKFLSVFLTGPPTKAQLTHWLIAAEHLKETVIWLVHLSVCMLFFFEFNIGRCSHRMPCDCTFPMHLFYCHTHTFLKVHGNFLFWAFPGGKEQAGWLLPEILDC